MAGLRVRLREETRDAHSRVDVLFSQFDLGRAADYTRFLQAHGRALLFLEVAGANADWPQAAPPPPSFAKSVICELASLGAEISARPTGAPLASVLGPAYVVAGSRLGAAQIRREVASGGTYLSDKTLDGYWPRISSWLSRQPACGAFADDTVKGALDAFEVFAEAAEHYLN